MINIRELIIRLTHYRLNGRFFYAFFNRDFKCEYDCKKN